MAMQMFWDARFFLGQLALHSVLKNMQMDDAFDQLPAECFGEMAHRSVPGLANPTFSVNGLVELVDDGQDEVMTGNLAASNIPASMMSTNTPAVGDRARFFTAQQASYSFGGPHGQLLPFQANGAGSNGHRMVNGCVLEVGDALRSTSASGSQTSNPGALASSRYLYAVLHVWFMAGTPTLNVIVESAATGDTGFASPTTRFTFAQKTAVGYAFTDTVGGLIRVAGPITDTRWRCSWVIGGGTPSAKFAVLMGFV